MPNRLSNPPEHPEGKEFSHSTYVNHPCHCFGCKKAHAVYQLNRTRIRNARLAELPHDQHGSESTYNNYLCRCIRCVEAHAEALRLRRFMAREEQKL